MPITNSRSNLVTPNVTYGGRTANMSSATQHVVNTSKSNTWFRKFGKWFNAHPLNELGKLWNRLTGETQRQEALEDRAHDETYNSPAAQLARNKLAGVATTGLQSVPTDSSGMSNETADGAVSLLSGLGGMINNGIGSAISLLGLRKQRAEIDNLNARTANTSSDTVVKGLNADYLKAVSEDRVKQMRFVTLSHEQGLNKLIEEVENLRVDRTIKGKEGRLKDLAISLAESTFDSNVQLAALSVEDKELSNKIKEFNLEKTLPKQLEELNSLIAHYKNADTIARYNADTSRQLALNDYQRVVNDCNKVSMMQGYYDEQTRSLKFDNDAMQATYDDYVSSLKSTYHLSDVEANWAATHQWLKVVNSAAVTVGQAASAYASIKRGRPNGRTGRMTSFNDSDWEVGSAILM